jgi:hypothetical protein
MVLGLQSLASISRPETWEADLPRIQSPYGASGLFYASGTGTSTGLGGITDGTIVMFSVDIGAGKLWLGLGGVWSGDPASGTSPFYSGLSTSVSYYPACTPWSADGINVGLTIQGDGNNSYPPPAGFTLYTV